jgi:hypothetical protein
MTVNPYVTVLKGELASYAGDHYPDVVCADGKKRRLEEIAKTCRSVAALESARVKREAEGARQAQLRAERQATAARAREVASMRAWQMAPLRCRDGTLSPSCVCGQGSKRGCCSHHGGVAGCSAPYPR